MGWLTIHDEKSIEIMNNEMDGGWYTDRIKYETKFREYGAADFDWFGVGDGNVFRDVFYRRAWIVERLAPIFKLRTAVERTTGGFQTALLLERV